MVNFEKNRLQLNVDAAELPALVRTALAKSVDALLSYHEATPEDLAQVTNRFKVYLSFAWIARDCITSLPDESFTFEYLQKMLEVNLAPKGRGVSGEEFTYLTGITKGHPCWLRSNWQATFRTGCGLLLLALHEVGALTLPFGFSVPYSNRKGQRTDIGGSLHGELLTFLRSLNTANEAQAEPAFSGLTSDNRELLLSYGTKTLLALGWRCASDINLADLVALRDANAETGFAGKNSHPPYRLFIDVLARKFKVPQSFSLEEWSVATGKPKAAQAIVPLRTRVSVAAPPGPKKGVLSPAAPPAPELSPDEQLLQDVQALMPSAFQCDRLPTELRFPGYTVSIAPLSETWLKVQAAFIEKSKRRENKKTDVQALGYLNIYLFAYLPAWAHLHPSWDVPFPAQPNKLIRGVHFSRLVPVPPNTVVPLCFLEMLEHLRKERDWAPEYLYAMLKVLERFFDFVENFSDELPGCAGFKQPITEFDFPGVSRSIGTNKGFIPRQAFGFVLAYVEAMAAYTEAITDRILSGELSDDSVKGTNNSLNLLDTLEMQDVYGFVPLVYWRGKRVLLRYVPNVLWIERHQLKDGRTLRLPQPHALNQLLVALHTGLRNNHIQWLDAELFDRMVEENDVFPRLWVNTDKAKSSGWSPSVHRDVITILRKQLAWRNLIGDPGFRVKIPYNNNEHSKWGKFYPLFSSSSDGRPHNDSRYYLVWATLLAGAQGVLREADIHGVNFGRLLPPGIGLHDLDINEKLEEACAAEEWRCHLKFVSDITPHSARVSVVSHLISVLPAEFIGKNITGQSEGLVYHYVKLDPDEMAREQQLQHLVLRTKAQGESLEAVAQGQSDPRFIKADQVNSRLAQSMRQDLPETLASYGCVSLTLTEEGKSGMDVLTETGGRNAAFNKTEICPYGNNCPSDVLKMLKGLRRCGLCPYAVRSIDHLPAVAAKKKQMMELQQTLDDKLESETHSPQDQEAIEVERQRINEELTGWVVVEEILEATRERIASGADTRRWVVQKPEIIEQDLRRVVAPTEATQYVLARLAECTAYPALDSPQIRSQFDMLRRQMSARLGRFKEAFDLKVPANPAQECAGLLRSLAGAYQLEYEDIVRLLSTDEHLAALPVAAAKLLEIEHV